MNWLELQLFYIFAAVNGINCMQYSTDCVRFRFCLVLLVCFQISAEFQVILLLLLFVFLVFCYFVLFYH